jgi:hypothetical protein
MSAPAIVRWEAPPPRHPLQERFRTRERIGPWQPVADALRRKPGEWAVVWEGTRQSRAGYLAWVIRKGALQGFEAAGDFDAVTAKLADDRWAVYARWVF